MDGASQGRGESVHAEAPSRPLGPGKLGGRPRVHGHVRGLWTCRSGREHRHHRAAVEMGVTLLDTGDFYGMGHNEMLLGEALRGIPRDAYQLSVKFGAMRDHGGAWLGFDGRPPAVKKFLAYSLQRLGVDHVDLPTRQARPFRSDRRHRRRHRGLRCGRLGPPNRPFGGRPETIRRAAATHPICDLQIEYALVTRNIEARILPTCRELGIGITAYGVLARGLIGGDWKPEVGSRGTSASTRPVSRPRTPPPTWRSRPGWPKWRATMA